MKTTIDPFTTITDEKLDAVTGGTLGPEPGVPDPGNDPAPSTCTSGGILSRAVCRALQDHKQA